MNAMLLRLPPNARGVLWVVLGMSLFTLVNALFKQLGEGLPLASVMFLRALAILALIAPFALRRRGAAIRTRKPGLHLGRMLFTSISAGCALYALTRLSLGEVTVYALTTSIWMIPLGLLFLGESVRPLRWLGVAIGFAGVWLVARPELGGWSWALAAALAGALADGGLGVLLKRGAGSETALAILWWTYLGQLLVFGGLAGFAPPALALAQVLGVLLMAAASIACMLCFVRGYRVAEASLAETGCFSGLLVGPLLGWTMFGETLDAHFWLGAALLTGGILVALFEPDPRKLWRRAPRPLACEG
ncbi:DMT family transporter [Chitinimonas koreensis]|uniref:DMT family transporter n=1 Tax=Chitinimonas koreensis TaxID=356302 RepID=UPI00146FB746|nr:DMT family transporter [Chitinimonas koreensis]QNM96081.1 DMT family transporter [Chitinimonas koreensis]